MVVVIVIPDFSRLMDVIPVSKKYAKKAWNVGPVILDVIGCVMIMTILVLDNHVEVLMESNVIAYVKKMANLLYAFTLTLTAMTLSILTMIMNVIQI